MARLARGLLGVLALLAAGAASAQTIDLDDARAVEQLRASNPAHFDKIVQIVAELRARPSRAQGEWLQANFGAREIDLGMVMLASDPPKQPLQFNLDDARYRLTLARFDLSENLRERLRENLHQRDVTPSLVLQRSP